MLVVTSDGSVVSFQKTTVAVVASVMVFLKITVVVVCAEPRLRLWLLHTILIQLKIGGNKKKRICIEEI